MLTIWKAKLLAREGGGMGADEGSNGEEGKTSRLQSDKPVPEREKFLRVQS